MKLMPDCNEASRLTSFGQDRKLTWRESLGLRLHLFMCSMCRQYVRQLEILRGALKRLGDADAAPPQELGEAGKARIRARLGELGE